MILVLFIYVITVFCVLKPLYIVPVEVFKNNDQDIVDLNIIFPTVDEVNEGIIREDCGDIRVMFSEPAHDGDYIYDYWIEGGCGTEETSIWVRLMDLPTEPYLFQIYVGYGNLDMVFVGIEFHGNFVTMINGSCPNDSFFFEPFLGRTPLVGEVSGSQNDQHEVDHRHEMPEFKLGKPEPILTNDFRLNYTSPENNRPGVFDNHTHFCNVQMNNSKASVPSYHLSFCVKTPESKIIGKNVPANSVVMVLGMEPIDEMERLSYFEEMEDRFPFGIDVEDLIGMTGGSVEHNHFFTTTNCFLALTETINVFPYGTNEDSEIFPKIPSDLHQHEFSGDTAPESSLPPHVVLPFAIVGGEGFGGGVPGSVVMTLEGVTLQDLPIGYTRINTIEGFEQFRDKFVRGGRDLLFEDTEVGHSHEFHDSYGMFSTTPEAYNSYSLDSPYSESRDHTLMTHSHLFDPDQRTGVTMSRPPFYSIQFWMRKVEPDVSYNILWDLHRMYYWECFYAPSDTPSVCGNKGYCLSKDNCTCFHNYYGENCIEMIGIEAFIYEVDRARLVTGDDEEGEGEEEVDISDFDEDLGDIFVRYEVQKIQLQDIAFKQEKEETYYFSKFNCSEVIDPRLNENIFGDGHGWLYETNLCEFHSDIIITEIGMTDQQAENAGVYTLLRIHQIERYDLGLTTLSAGYTFHINPLSRSTEWEGKDLTVRTIPLEGGQGEEDDDVVTTIVAISASSVGAIAFGLIGLSTLLLCLSVCYCCICLFLLSLCFCCCYGNIYIRNRRKQIRFKEISDAGLDLDVILEEKRISNAKVGEEANFKISKELFEIDYKKVKLISEIGRGGSGACVFRAAWQNRKVAFKVFQTRDIANQRSFEEFEKELNILASLSHPNILKFYGASLYPPRVGLVTELCENGSLTSYIRLTGMDETKVITEHLKLSWLMDICCGMHFLNEKNIIHRDLKCENVLLDNSLDCKLIDFGLSRKTVSDESVRMTSRIGTMYYMAPEVTMGGEYSFSCDIFSFGIIMWEVWSESFQPYGDEYQMAIEMKVANRPDYRPQVPEDCPNWYSRLMVKSWQHDPMKRPKNFKAMMDEIELHVERPESGGMESEDGVYTPRRSIKFIKVKKRTTSIAPKVIDDEEEEEDDSDSEEEEVKLRKRLKKLKKEMKSVKKKLSSK